MSVVDCLPGIIKGGADMKTVKDEKEWLRRMRSEAAAHEERKTANRNVKERCVPKRVKKSGDGFKSVAGMDHLKQMLRRRSSMC